MVKIGGQVSTEFIILFSLLIIFLVPMTYLILQSALSSTEQVTSARVNSIFSEIATESREVYFRGLNSKIVISANIPRNVNAVSIVEAENTTDNTKKYLIRVLFTAERIEQQAIIPLEVPIKTSDLTEELRADKQVLCIGDYSCTTYNFTENFSNEGLRHIQIANVIDGSDIKVELTTVSV